MEVGGKSKSALEIFKDLARGKGFAGKVTLGETQSRASRSFAVPPRPTEPDQPETSPGSKEVATWVEPGTSVRFGSTVVSGGMFYVPSRLTRVASATSVAIDPRLDVGDSFDAYFDNVGYWPRYAKLGPNERAAFVDWLASDRTTKVHPTIAFLYFYGLERRIVFDECDEAEKREAVLEINRIRLITEGKSWEGYIKRMLAYAIDVGIVSPRDVDHGDAMQGPTIEVRLRAARGLKAIGKITPEDFVSLKLSSLVVGQAQKNAWCDDADRNLAALTRAIRDKFGDQLAPASINPACGTALRYKAAFEDGSVAKYATDLADLPAIEVQDFRPVLQYAQAVTRQILKRPASAGGVHVDFAATPQDILGYIPSVQDLISTLSSAVATGAGRIALGDLAEALMVSEGEYARVDWAAVQAFANRIGFDVEVVSAPDGEGFACVAPLGEKEAAMDLHRAYAIAVVGAFFSSAAQAGSIGMNLAKKADLSEPAKIRLMRVVADTFVALKEAEKPTKVIPSKLRKATLLEVLAMLDGNGLLSHDAVVVLEGLFDQAKLDKAPIYATAQGLTAAGDDTGLLDDARLAAISSQTDEIHTHLAAIFVDDDHEPETSEAVSGDAEAEVADNPGGITQASDRVADEVFCVDARHSAFLRNLVSSQDIDDVRLAVIARDCGLMPRGAVDRINEWGLEQDDETVIESVNGFWIVTDFYATKLMGA